ncbi:DMT family transporter [Crassaminicella profunda]|uniref:DMT family transporter n=1 Tax=Crassaminicella profunda TaxID=1286698 RepID=UPI001CA782A1|nr:EamA family transporter [Crassaminicella profunda]QZY55738.1 DMT family transporter [Crassaminicella profunda]
MKKIYGVIYSMISAALFGLQPVLAKIAYNNGMNTTTLLFLRFFLGAIMIFTYMNVKHIDFKINKKQGNYLIFLGIVGYGLTAFLLFLAYHYISVGLATILHFVYPIFVTILAFILYKEKLKMNKILALVLSGFGIYFLVGDGYLHLNMKGVILALISGISYAVYMVGLANKLFEDLNNYVMTFYLSLVAAIFLIVLGFVNNSIVLHMNKIGMSIAISIAFISSVIAPMLLLEGIRIIGPSNAAILSTFEPIVGTILGIIVLHECFTIKIAMGSALILVSVVMVTMANRNEQKKVECEK